MSNDWKKHLNTKFLFFTGKGGVGKTSLACASALFLAEQGKRVLIISTDPASNLDEMFNQKLTEYASPVNSINNLYALNIDPEKSAANYREKMIAPYKGKLSEAVINSIEEQFSGSCTTEIAAFDEFVRLIADPEITNKYDHLIFDTAPTGHTLRLLSLPGAWNSYLNTTSAESSCLGPLSGLKDQKEQYEKAIHELADGKRSTIVLVARADSSSLKEAKRAYVELSELGIRNSILILNAVFRSNANDRLASSITEKVETSIRAMPDELRTIPKFEIPLLSVNTVGIEAIRSILKPQEIDINDVENNLEIIETIKLQELIKEISKEQHGVIMTMGKGGVGKTFVACKIARELADLGHEVLLTTTDPAGNINDFFEQTSHLQENKIKIEKINPIIEVENYRDEVLKNASTKLDQQALALLEEDLRSPCTEEIAVFHAFAKAVEKGKDKFVVIDTAPTGHTILLMDATESYHREVLRTNSNAPESVKNLLPKLRDINYSKIILVTLPEPTPVHEAQKLQNDLKRAKIDTYAWIINRALISVETKDPILKSRASKEQNSIAEVLKLHKQVSIIPWQI